MAKKSTKARIQERSEESKKSNFKRNVIIIISALVLGAAFVGIIWYVRSLPQGYMYQGLGHSQDELPADYPGVAETLAIVEDLLQEAIEGDEYGQFIEDVNDDGHPDICFAEDEAFPYCFVGTMEDFRIFPTDGIAYSWKGEGANNFTEVGLLLPPSNFAPDSLEFYNFVEAFFVKEVIMNTKAHSGGCQTSKTNNDLTIEGCFLMLDIYAAILTAYHNPDYSEPLAIQFIHHPQYLANPEVFVPNPSIFIWENCQMMRAVMIEYMAPARNWPDLLDPQAVWETIGCSRSLPLWTW